jgi:hypothetical protein
MNTIRETFLQGFNGLNKNDLYFIFFQICSILFMAYVIRLVFFYRSGKNPAVAAHPVVLHALIVCCLTCVTRFNAALALLALPVIYFLLKNISAQIMQVQVMQVLALAAAIMVGSGSVALALIFTIIFILVVILEKIK